MYDLIKIAPLSPLIGFALIGLFGKKMKNETLIGAIASSAIAISFIAIFYSFINFAQDATKAPVIVNCFDWISVGTFKVSLAYQVDQLSLLFGMIITGIGFLIHIYSMGYMHGDKSFYRFFAYLNLFIFMMLNLVLASSYLVTFLGWEGVGLCSYLLIGFWYDRKFEGVRITWTGEAANKAFIVNRIGDFGFLIGMFLVYLTFGSLNYLSVAEQAGSASVAYYNTGIITAITMFFFLGCTGKSAQIPLAVWLPDAMAGPTPVSALIHAATMVTAGIFLVARNATLFALSPITMDVVLIVGIATAFLAATVGLVQNDIKKVLAYSTVSQLGFMFAALGAGAFTAGVFHVMTHAFFKGLLFLGAGSIIHGMHEEQNIKKMGGLKSKMPKTYFTFMIATLAISGIPFFSGFFSKDEILWQVYSQGGILPWAILALAAMCTAFYMFRLFYLVFYGEARYDSHHVHPHESPNSMTFPLIVLAVLSAFGGFLGVPEAIGGFFSEHPNILHNWLAPRFEDAEKILVAKHGIHHAAHIVEYAFMLISVLIALFAIYKAKKYYFDDNTWKTPRKLVKKHRFVYNMLLNKYKLDEFYFGFIVDGIVSTSRDFLWKIFDVKLIDGTVNGSARSTMSIADYVRRIQTGLAQNYALLMTAGIIVILGIFLFM
jgi:NADH-quinone oxidoreductase subunit L